MQASASFRINLSLVVLLVAATMLAGANAVRLASQSRRVAARRAVLARSEARAASESQQGSKAWPPPNMVYEDPAKPPAWMQTPVGYPAVPGTPPAPVAAGALLPTDPFVINGNYFDQLSQQIAVAAQAPSAGGAGGSAPAGQDGKAAGGTAAAPAQEPAWPPSPPRGMPMAVPGVPGMRPLTLMDVKGGEYARDDPEIGKGKAKKGGKDKKK